MWCGRIYLAASLLGVLVAGNFLSHEEPGRMLQKVKVDSTSGILYVGGENLLVKLDENLTLVDKLSTGPVEDSINCDPSQSCADLQLTNNDAKIVDIDPVSGRVIFCGSVKHGLCSFIQQNDFAKSDLQYMDPSNRYNYGGGRKSGFAFFGDTTLNEPSATTNAFYIACTFDDRPSTIPLYALSARQIAENSLSLVHEDNEKSTSVTFAEPLKSGYIVNYIYGFQHDGFSYFVTIQREDVNIKDRYETRLVRVCQNDAGFNSYTEVRLLCRKRNGILTVYNIAQAAHLAPVGKEMRDKFGIDENEMALYVMFGKSNGLHDTANPSYGSGLCVFLMSQIRKDFQTAQMECYMDQGDLLPWLYPDERPCRKDVSKNKRINGQNINLY